jgi:hypothetical protein
MNNHKKILGREDISILNLTNSAIFQHPVALFMSQVYTLFTVLKCNLVFVFRCCDSVRNNERQKLSCISRR